MPYSRGISQPANILYGPAGHRIIASPRLLVSPNREAGSGFYFEDCEGWSGTESWLFKYPRLMNMFKVDKSRRRITEPPKAMRTAMQAIENPTSWRNLSGRPRPCSDTDLNRKVQQFQLINAAGDEFVVGVPLASYRELLLSLRNWKIDTRSNWRYFTRFGCMAFLPTDGGVPAILLGVR